MENLRACPDAAGGAIPAIPVSLGTFFQREIGFGLGYRYTLAGIRDIDTETSPSALVQILDRVASVPAYPPLPNAWVPTNCCVAFTVGFQNLSETQQDGREADPTTD